MILVDTSVWVDHLRKGNDQLAAMLRVDEVACHPFVIGELACGTLHNRSELLGLLSALPQTSRVGEDEALAFIERHRLMGRGLSWVDVHLLASCMLDTMMLWTRDKALSQAAAEIGLPKRKSP